jgi:hypothetical protein
MVINTGEERSVTGNVVSGAVASATIASGINYSQYKRGAVDKQTAVKNTIKLSIQGGIATGAAIAAANYLGRGSLLGMLSSVSFGIAGVYGVEKISEAIDEKMAKVEVVENQEEEENNG